MQQITSRDNATYKALRSPRQEGSALLEGFHLIEAYRERIGWPESLVVSESGEKTPEIQSLLSAYPGPVVRLTDRLFQTLSDLVTPVGLLAVISIPQVSEKMEGSCVLLEEIQDAGNVGSILRTAAAAGIRDIALSPGCAGAWTPKVLRAAQGAHFGLRIREQVDLEALLKKWQGTSIATVVKSGSSIYTLNFAGDVAWLFGNEGAGLSSVLIELATVRAEIPMIVSSESLNVAAAAAICLFEEVRLNKN
ncbi:MAG: RNA methyltransferase [Rhodocyclaceae bacterium]|nr:RNA methyltransferase [Rhodocyclaceae bacterium]